MSGSSNAGRTLSRCEVSLDAGISISWAPDPDGSIEHGMRHHREEEAKFLALIDAASSAIEVLFDELEMAGRRFHAPGKSTSRAQDASTGMPIVEVRVWCEPRMSEEELKTLVERVARLINAPAG